MKTGGIWGEGFGRREVYFGRFLLLQMGNGLPPKLQFRFCSGAEAGASGVIAFPKLELGNEGEVRDTWRE